MSTTEDDKVIADLLAKIKALEECIASQEERLKKLEKKRSK